MKSRAEKAYQSRHSTPAQVSTQTDTDSISIDDYYDFSPDRDIIQRVRYVFDQILGMMPKQAEKDVRFTMMKTFMYESLKDLARVPDPQIVQMTGQMANALQFVANGTMAELHEMLEENAGD